MNIFNSFFNVSFGNTTGPSKSPFQQGLAASLFSNAHQTLPLQYEKYSTKCYRSLRYQSLCWRRRLDRNALLGKSRPSRTLQLGRKLRSPRMNNAQLVGWGASSHLAFQATPIGQAGGIPSVDSRRHVVGSRKVGDRGDNEFMRLLRSESRRCTNILLGLNTFCFIAQFATRGRLLAWGSKINSLVSAGQYWRLFSSALLHVNLIHLAVNSYSLHNVGPALEGLAGRDRFFLTYVSGAFVGNLLSWKFTPGPAVGASGAIFGVVGGLTVYFARHRDLLGKSGDRMLQSMKKTIVLNFMFGLMARSIDNWGHFGGLLGGAFASWLLGPNIVHVTTKGMLGTRSHYVDSPPLQRLLTFSRPPNAR